MKLFIAIAAMMALSAHAAPPSGKRVWPIPPSGEPSPSKILSDRTLRPVKVDFHGMSVSQAVAVVYSEILMQPYVIDPAVLKDDRPVSLRFDATKGDIKAFWRNFLDSLGLAVMVRGGVDYVALKKPDEHLDDRSEIEPFIYRTKYRSTGYLVELLAPLFDAGGFALNRQVRASVGDKITVGANPPPPNGSAAALIDQDSDTLIFQGTAKEIKALEKLLTQVDVAAGEVVIRAVIYEVSTGKSDGTAFTLAANILGGKFGVSFGSPGDMSNSISLRTANIEAAFAILAGDSRFKAVSTPRVRIKSGGQARLTVGQDVPTLGAVTVPQGGTQAVQSVEYRASGVILALSPVVRDAAIEVIVDQQISDFARTETGVNNSPTLTKRSLTTTVAVADGELVVLGGLTQERNTFERSGTRFLPELFRSNRNIDSRTEILLLMQVSRVSN